MSSQTPDQVPPFPVVIDNPPGRSVIAYRVGDYAAFRDALLQGRPGEQELKGWRPTEGDLGLQLLEWWAYLADVLTFYNEVIANQSYLGTAVLPPPLAPAPAGGAPAPAGGAPAPSGAPGTPGAAPADPTSAQKIARVVGYRPKPGIAATGMLGVLVNALRPITVPAGFAVQSKPGPGQQPQVFEADPSQTQYLPTTAGGAVRIDLHVPTQIDSAPTDGLLLLGNVSSVKAGDMVVVALDPSQIPAGAGSGSPISAAGVVQSIATENDPRGKPNTRFTFASLTIPAGLTGTDVQKVQVLRSIQSVTVYASVAQDGNAPTAITSSGGSVVIHLAQTIRAITVGDTVVLEVPPAAPPGQPAYFTAVVDKYEEVIWYANAVSASAPDTPPTTPANVVPISVPHTVLTLGLVSGTQILSTARVWYAYRPVGTPIDEFAKSPILANAVGSLSPPPATPPSQANEIVLVDTPATIFRKGDTVLLEGADGIGAVATLTASTAGGQVALQSTDTTSLVLPLRILFNLMHVTAGKTVTNEVLGNGDATLAGQSFTLQKSPLTYVAGKLPGFPQSTLQVFVDGTQWTEVASFSGQPRDAKVFVTQESPSHVTTVLFGDGVSGVRLPTGTGNVTATYRHGSGPGDPALGGPPVGTLVTVLSPQPGLQAVRNPVPMTGGAAPTSAQQVQASAPAATLTFGRAVSSADFEAISSQAPQVSRVRTVFGWDRASRRALSKVYVAGGADAVAGVSHALAQASDPNVPVRVIAATEIDVSLSFSVVYDPSHDPGDVASAVTNALADQGAGPFSPAQLRIGDPLRASAISAACLSVPGVIAIRKLQAQDVTDPDPKKHTPLSIPADPGEGGFFALAAGDVHPTMEAGDG